MKEGTYRIIGKKSFENGLAFILPAIMLTLIIFACISTKLYEIVYVFILAWIFFFILSVRFLLKPKNILLLTRDSLIINKRKTKIEIPLGEITDVVQKKRRKKMDTSFFRQDYYIYKDNGCLSCLFLGGSQRCKNRNSEKHS